MALSNFEFHFCEQGYLDNDMDFKEFQEHLDKEFAEHKLSVQKHLVPRMKDMALDSYLSSR